MNLNPFIGYSNSYEIWLLNYDTLVAVGADGLPSKETGLVEDWELSADQEEWTFRIREGVTWQDGVPLTAHDVAWTFNTIIENELSLAVYLKDDMLLTWRSTERWTRRRAWICSSRRRA